MSDSSQKRKFLTFCLIFTNYNFRNAVIQIPIPFLMLYHSRLYQTMETILCDRFLVFIVFFFSGFQLQKWRYDRQYQHQYSSLPCSGLEFRNRIQSANLFNTTRRSSVKTCSFWNVYFTGLYYSFLFSSKNFFGTL